MNEDDLLNLVITERMSWHGQRFREQDPKEDGDALIRSEAFKKYEKLAMSMTEEEAAEMNECLDEMLNLMSEDNERYYRAGIEDGIRIDQLIQKVKEKQD